MPNRIKTYFNMIRNLTNARIPSGNRAIITFVITMCTFFILSSTTLAQSKTYLIKILDCNSSDLLSDCFVYDSKHNLIGISDSLGLISISRNLAPHDSIAFIKLGYSDKRTVLNKRESAVCLEPSKINIDTVSIISNAMNPLDHLTELMEWNATQWNPENNSYIYDFIYSVSCPDSGWVEEFKGKIFLPFMQSNLHGGWKPLRYVVIDSYSIDSAFLLSPVYSEMPGNRINQNINGLIISDKNIKRTYKRYNRLEYNHDNQNQNLISFYSKHKKEKKLAQIVDFDRETKSLIKREVWCLSCTFSINKWRATDFREVEIYRNDGSLFLDTYSLQDGFSKDGVVVYHRFEMNYSGKIKGDINERVVLPKVRMSSNNFYLTELMKEVNIHYDKAAVQKLLESSGISK